VLRVLSLLPLPLLYALCGAAAWATRVVGWRRNFVEDGLSRCLPGASPEVLERAIRDFYVHLGELVAEAIHGFRISGDELVRRVAFEDEQPVVDALAAGRKVLLLTSHQCNWEWLLLRCSTAFGVPLTAAYKPASRERANVELNRLRSRQGATMVAAKQVVNHLIKRRGEVRLLALVADQSPAASNEQQQWVNFLGTETGFFAGPGWISARMGYQPFFIAMRQVSRGHYVARFVPLTAPDERPHPERTLEAYVRAVEETARSQPAQYFWAYNRWKRARPVYG
jgi:KDO2-lipid IV(A) lauroyltransferase